MYAANIIMSSRLFNRGLGGERTLGEKFGDKTNNKIFKLGKPNTRFTYQKRGWQRGYQSHIMLNFSI